MDEITRSINAAPVWMAFILLVATAFAWPISIGLILFYRHSVLKSMRRGTNPPNAAAPTPQVTLPVPELQFVDSRKLDRAPDQTVFKKLVRTPWRVAMVYVIAGCAFALTMTAAVLLSMGEKEFLLGRFVSLFWIYAWPAVLTINIVAAATFRTKFVIVLLYFLVLAAIAIAMNVISSEPNWMNHATLWFLYDVPASLILLAFLNRRIRAVGPLVLIFLMVSAFGALFPLLLLGSSEAAMRLAANLGPGAEVTLIALTFFGFVLAAPIGWLMLRWIRKRYESKKTSDHAIAVDTIWLLFGVVMSIELSPNGLWALSGRFCDLQGYFPGRTSSHSPFVRRQSQAVGAARFFSRQTQPAFVPLVGDVLEICRQRTTHCGDRSGYGKPGAS
jgi:hypothetical protein